MNHPGFGMIHVFLGTSLLSLCFFWEKMARLRVFGAASQVIAWRFCVRWFRSKMETAASFHIGGTNLPAVFHA
ncbi:MAG: hypothetical protein D6714_04150 [Bacteroidetes bacterium]|nr:MAG: hypothetical protein D6714_04150 [Bacteroidota bacterium]